MNLNDLKQIFRDVKKHVFTCDRGESYASVQDKVNNIVDILATGLVTYDYYGQSVTIYTSDMMLAHLERLTEGSKAFNWALNKEGIITSPKPYLLGGSLVVSILFDGVETSSDCILLYDSRLINTSGTKIRTVKNYSRKRDEFCWGVSAKPEGSRTYCKYFKGHQGYDTHEHAMEACETISKQLANGATFKYHQGNKPEYVDLIIKNKE